MEETSKAEQYRKLLISLRIGQIFQCFERTYIELALLSYNEIATYKTELMNEFNHFKINIELKIYNENFIFFTNS